MRANDEEMASEMDRIVDAIVTDTLDVPVIRFLRKVRGSGHRGRANTKKVLDLYAKQQREYHANHQPACAASAQAAASQEDEPGA